MNFADFDDDDDDEMVYEFDNAESFEDFNNQRAMKKIFRELMKA